MLLIFYGEKTGKTKCWYRCRTTETLILLLGIHISTVSQFRKLIHNKISTKNEHTLGAIPWYFPIYKSLFEPKKMYKKFYRQFEIASDQNNPSAHHQ